MSLFTLIRMYLEKVMKNLFAIIVFLLGSYYVSATEVKSSRTIRSETSAHDKLSSIKPSIEKSSTQQVLLTKNGGKISISRRSQTSKIRHLTSSSKIGSNSKSLRGEQPTLSNEAFGFSIYSATTYLDVDRDGDGYYSQFGIDFDADFDTATYADVYAIIYFSENGGPWTEFSFTEDFTIFSNDSDDEYSATFTLNSDFPANQYDFLIDLYEVGFSGIVATIGPEEDADLFALPLEDDIGDSFIGYVGSDLFGDFDEDGFYTDLTLEYDIDTQRLGDTVYAEIIFINRAEGWQQTVYSDNFNLGNQTEFIDLTFNAGYPAGFYDIQLNLIDYQTDEVIADAGQEFSSLNGLPIESTDNDIFFDGPEPVVDVVVHGSSGSLGWSVILIGLLVLVRTRG